MALPRWGWDITGRPWWEERIYDDTFPTQAARSTIAILLKRKKEDQTWEKIMVLCRTG